MVPSKAYKQREVKLDDYGISITSVPSYSPRRRNYSSLTLDMQDSTNFLLCVATLYSDNTYMENHKGECSLQTPIFEIRIV